MVTTAQNAVAPCQQSSGTITVNGMALTVHPDLPVHSVADLVKLAKERPLSYGT